MDVIIPLIIVIVVISVIVKWCKINNKTAEEKTASVLSLLPDCYRVFENVLLNNNGRTAHLDHLLVSPFGVFVIESKGCRGWILGGENSEYWTQSLFKRKYTFYNPIKQNEKHIKFLRELLSGSVDVPFIPIVVFCDDAEIKVYVEHYDVVNVCKLKNVIAKYKTATLSDSEINWIINTINKHCGRSDEDFARHNETVSNAKQNADVSISNGICPRCGGKLIKREGKYGDFYGCSNFPKCKFTIKA